MNKRSKNIIIFIASFIIAFLIVGYIKNTMFASIRWTDDATIWDKFREYYIRTFLSNIIPALIISIAVTVISNSIKFRINYKLWIFIAVILAALSIITVSYYNERVEALEKNIKSLIEQQNSKKQEYALLQDKAESLESQLDELKKKEEYLPFSDEILLNELSHSGFKGEIKEIEADLLKHPELIPYSGVLGGTMGYASIRVLSDKWVLAYIEDGHIGGYMILSYKWNDGSFKWKVVDSYIMGEE